MGLSPELSKAVDEAVDRERHTRAKLSVLPARTVGAILSPAELMDRVERAECLVHVEREVVFLSILRGEGGGGKIKNQAQF